MREIKPIEFKVSRCVEVIEFPEHIVATLEALIDNPTITIDDNGLIFIKVDNGWAKYKLDKIQDSSLGICLERVTFKQMPRSIQFNEVLSQEDIDKLKMQWERQYAQAS